MQTNAQGGETGELSPGEGCREGWEHEAASVGGENAHYLTVMYVETYEIVHIKYVYCIT